MNNLTPEEKGELREHLEDYSVHAFDPNCESCMKLRQLIESCPAPRTDEEWREFIEKQAQYLMRLKERWITRKEYEDIVDKILSEWDGQKGQHL